MGQWNLGFRGGAWALPFWWDKGVELGAFRILPGTLRLGVLGDKQAFRVLGALENHVCLLEKTIVLRMILGTTI